MTARTRGRRGALGRARQRVTAPGRRCVNSRGRGPHASRRAASAARCQRAGNPPGSPSRVRWEDHTEVSSARQLWPGRGCVPIGSPDCYIALLAVLRSLRLALWSVPPAGLPWEWNGRAKGCGGPWREPAGGWKGRLLSVPLLWAMNHRIVGRCAGCHVPCTCESKGKCKIHCTCQN